MVRKFFFFAVTGLLLFFQSIPATVHGENIVITTDRDVYVAGDVMYFSLHLTNSSTETSDYGYITLFGSSGKNIFNGFLKYEKNATNGSVYLNDTLVTGIYQLVCFTNCMRNSGQYSYARKNILIINRFDRAYSNFFLNAASDYDASPAGKTEKNAHPDIMLDKKNLTQREKFSFSVVVPEPLNSKPYSLSVRQKAPVSLHSPESSADADPLPTPCYYLPEKKGVVLQGMLLDENKNPVVNRHVFLSGVDTTANLQQTVTGPGGLFRFFLNPWYFGKTIMIKSDNTFKGSIETDNKYRSVKPSLKNSLIISGDLNKFVENSQKYLTIQKSYKNDFRKVEKKNMIEKGYRPLVYDVAYQVIFPSDFVYLPNFMEISREIIPLIKTRETRDGYVASIINLNQKEYTDLFIFVDGILTEDVNQIILFDSQITRKIEIMPNTRYIGGFSIPGILSITTATKEIYKLPWKFPMTKLQTDSIMDHISYAPPATGTVPRYIPDYRQLLLWEPSLDFGNKNSITLETSTSDCTGEFEIVLTCPDDHGKAMEFKSSFYVNHP
jgi:hypothetical protein